MLKFMNTHSQKLINNPILCNIIIIVGESCAKHGKLLIRFN